MANGKSTLSLKNESVLPIKSKKYLTDVMEETENAQDITRAYESKSYLQPDYAEDKHVTKIQSEDTEEHSVRSLP